MRLVSFQIKCFKSIIDSGECILANDITILAGKNESGKTSLLQALNRFNFKGKPMPNDARVQGKELRGCTITLKVCYSQEEFIVALDEVSSDVSEEVLSRFRDAFLDKDEHEISFIVDGTGSLVIENTTIQRIRNALVEEMESVVIKGCKAIWAEAQSKNPNLPPSTKNVVIPTGLRPFTDGFKSFADGFRANFHQFCAENGINPADFATEIDQTEEVLKQPDTMWQDIKSIQNVLQNMCPEIVFFSSFDDVLAFSRPVAKIEDDGLLLDFFKLADIDRAKLLAYNLDDASEALNAKNYLKGKSATITNNFKKFWQQGDLSLEAEIGNGNLSITVADADGTRVSLKPEQRSDGFKWFLEFFIKLNARETDKARIILIDEPGLYLHAKAQRDVLRVLENLAKEHNDQIIITSHSPYFIDTEKLNRVRLVNKHEKKGTEIENKLHADAESDARTPIITAIGLDLAKNLTSLSDGSVLVEGISDYYYLSKFAELKGVEGLNFVPAVGALNVATLASLHIGYGISFVAILDNDSEGKRAEKLLQKLDIKDGRLIWVVEEKNRSVEDLFSMDDFLKYVAGEENFDASGYDSVSDLIKARDNNFSDKVGLSKYFSENKNVAFEDLSHETQKRVNRLFKNIEAGFETEKAELQTKEETTPNSIPAPPAI